MKLDTRLAPLSLGILQELSFFLCYSARLSSVYLRFWRFLKNCCKVAKLKDDVIKHPLNPIASIKTLVKHQLRVNKGHMPNGRVNNRVFVYQTKIRIGD